MATQPATAEERERELRGLVAPIVEELELSSEVLQRELDSSSAPVQEVSAHARRYRGKRLRAAAALLVAKAVRAAAEPPANGAARLTDAHIQIAAIVEMIHMATLVHDDVLDHAEVRRRVPTVNARYGNQVAVLLGDWIYARAFCLSTRLSDQTCSRALAATTATICRGEIEQSKAKYDFGLSVDRYVEMIDAKTASLYQASCELGAHYAGGSREIVAAASEFGRHLGLAFQIVDDCLDFDGAEDIVGKSLGTDVAEGKITLPIIHLLSGLAEPGRRRVEQIFRAAASDGVGANARLAAEFDLAHAVAASYEEARRYMTSAVGALRVLPASPSRTCLETMAAYVLGRRW